MRYFLPTLALAAALAAPAALSKADPEPQQQFIDKSYVLLPKSVGAYTLDTIEYDAAQIDAGVSSHYDVANSPGHFTLSLYVYPQGRGEEAKLVEQEIKNVEAVIRMQQDYSAVEADQPVEFLVDAPPSSLHADDKASEGEEQVVVFNEKDAAEVDPPPGSNGLDAVLKEIAPAKHSKGLRQDYSFISQGGKVRSAGLVFYRDLYYIKLRISVPFDAMDAPTFDAAITAAARALVPRVDVQNFGGCGDIVMTTPGKKGKQADEDAAAELLREFGRVRRENCASSEGKQPKPVPEGYERKEIVFPPGTWRRS